ncbi:uncharacterized protein LOC111077987 [Drosophila obscura]|uniref:uncharacterized protein LOC111077987 n=1 Tax=Drosophila obscura TaxID=7282 RepID=UPI001BB2AA1A|nr:uncharacterized protein LOC111077987 [Drosophila obscura]
MSAQNTEPGHEDIEAAFNRHSKIVPEVKRAYQEAIDQVFADLSAEDLAPFAAIHSEHGDTYLATDELVGSMRNKMTAILSQLNQHFFDSNDVERKLVELEMLKEKFAPYEGHNWNVNRLSPEDYTRPVRMRLLDSSIRVMERELAAQDKAIEVAVAISKSNRELLQSLQNERVKTNAAMEKQINQYTELDPTLLQLEQSINDSFLPPGFDPL